VLIAADGHKVLTNACPKTVEEIEELMKMEGLGNIKLGDHWQLTGINEKQWQSICNDMESAPQM
jgi:hypothetical protein